MTIMTLKIAILIQFLRIFIPAGERSKTYWATHALVWMNTICTHIPCHLCERLLTILL